MTIAEVAAKYAETKEALGVAKAGFDAAHAALEAAEKAEHEAWEALESLAGRAPVITEVVAPEVHPFVAYRPIERGPRGVG